MSIVSVIHGNNRYQNIYKALSLIKEKIKNDVKDKRKIVIKPNFVHTSIPLCATHIDVVKAVLDIITKYTKGKITIAEGSFETPTSKGFKNYGYYELQNNYNVEFIDLNTDDFVEVKLYDKNLKPLKFRLAKTVIESDYRVSCALLKTHDTVIATLSLKNIAVGALLKDETRDDKDRIHQGYKAINLNIAKLAEIIPPHLSVVDGFIGMQGRGPAHGEPIRMNLALAGTDFLAVDVIGTFLMGYDVKEVGYLYYCKRRGLGAGNLNEIKILGEKNWKDYRKKFKPHPEYNNQLKWKSG